MELRTDILLVNRETSDRGISVLDDDLIKRLQATYRYPHSANVKSFFDEVTATVNKSVNIVWERTLRIGSELYEEGWKDNVKSALSTRTLREERERLPDTDTTTRIALLWGATNANDKDSFETFSRRYAGTREWGVIASIACSPLCNTKMLHDIGTGIAKERGYEYILRVVSRNRNTSPETLQSIAQDPKLEERYTEVARTALHFGNQYANNLS